MVSGGADSIAMAHRILHGVPINLFDGRSEQVVAKERLHICHVNHGIRGLSAQEDAEFVEEFAARFGIAATIVEQDVPAYAQNAHVGIEAAAREVRYQVAGDLARKLAAQAGVSPSSVRICVAHTADDVAETFLMRACVGAGPKGLSSIPQKRGQIVRPFMDRTHRENCEYLHAHGEFWCEDETNRDLHYARNFVRHALLKPANERFSQATQHIVQSARLIADENLYMENIVRTLWPQLLKEDSPSLLAFDAHKLQALDVVLARRLVQRALLRLVSALNEQVRFEAAHIERVLELVAAGCGKCMLPEKIMAEVSHGFLTLSKTSQDAAGWLNVPGTFTLPDAHLIEARVAKRAQGEDAQALAQKLGRSQYAVAVFDYQALGEPRRLWIEMPRAGEVMQPFGMGGQTKRVSSVLSEAGFAPEHARRQCVIKDAPDGYVLALLGVRQAERAKVTSATDTLLFIKRS